MPETVRIGSRGPTVTFLQAQLNLVRPDLLPPLAMDGIFGPKTQARVMEFQRDKLLAVDGIVGPKTWAALLQPLPQPAVNQGRFRPCGNADPGNEAVIVRVEQSRKQAALNGFATGAESQGFLGRKPNEIVRLQGHPAEVKARIVYGTSLDYSTIFISNQLGLGGNPFTYAIRDELSGKIFQVMNCGTFQPAESLLLHELAHAWQSQHSFDGKRYMASCIVCMRNALAVNLAIGIFDAAASGHPDFPANFPMSAYAFMPGSAFGDYGPDQVARQVEFDIPAIVTHIRAAAPGSDAENERSLSPSVAMPPVLGATRSNGIEDRRKPGVQLL